MLRSVILCLNAMMKLVIQIGQVQLGDGRTGAVVSVTDYGPRGPWFETFLVALTKSHLPTA